MHLEYCLSCLDIWKGDFHHSIDSAWSGQGVVENVLPVGCRQDDHGLVTPEAVHFNEQLVEGRILLFVAGGLSLLANRIDLVNEDYRRGLQTGSGEELAHLGGSHPHEDLDKLAA